MSLFTQLRTAVARVHAARAVDQSRQLVKWPSPPYRKSAAVPGTLRREDSGCWSELAVDNRRRVVRVTAGPKVHTIHELGLSELGRDTAAVAALAALNPSELQGSKLYNMVRSYQAPNEVITPAFWDALWADYASKRPDPLARQEGPPSTPEAPKVGSARHRAELRWFNQVD